jgi:CDP-6-deoxy-D-xylo-4-hexulose-3-dehydrase
MTYRIPLVRDTISESDISNLIKWLETNPRLTKGENTVEFERAWSRWNGNKHSIFVSSGSAANLAAYYAMIVSGRMKNKKVIVPAVSWSTTVAPAIQLGLEPILCDCNMKNLGLDVDHLDELVKLHDPALIVTVNVLGFSNDYDKILEICRSKNILLIEDSCESIGTRYMGRNVGNFGDISTFSFYYGHHMSTIEGGMVCTSDQELDQILKSIRCHGWDRDLDEYKQKELRISHNIDDFRALYTFYYPGFNMRCTDLQAFLGIEQMKKIDHIVSSRQRNFDMYVDIVSPSWGLDVSDHDVVSNFTFPVITRDVSDTVNLLKEAGVESRPLICGSISRQPFWYMRYGHASFKNADVIHDFGLYVPNNPDMTEDEVKEVASIIRDA